MTSTATTEHSNTVPDSILFSHEFIRMPTFNELGFPELYSKLGIVSLNTKIGEWVNRGDDLFTILYTVFDLPTKPKLWQLQRDITYPKTYSIPSPVSGLVIDMRAGYVGYHCDPRATNSGRSISYSRSREVFPAILLPLDEPPANNDAFYTYESIKRLMREAGKRLLFSHSTKGYIRLKDAEYSDEQFQEAIVAVRDDSSPIGQFEPSLFDTGNAKLVDIIQRLRASDLTLRDKLVHLIKQ